MLELIVPASREKRIDDTVIYNQDWKRYLNYFQLYLNYFFAHIVESLRCPEDEAKVQPFISL